MSQEKDKRISLSELKAKRADATHGLWEKTGPHLVAGRDYDVASCEDVADATCIVATHNACDVLVEIAEAALTLRELELEGEQFGYYNEPTEEQHESLVRRNAEANEKLKAAVAKVKL